MSINTELNYFLELKRRIQEAEPDIDEATLVDTLEGATNLHEALAEVARSALLDETMISALKLRLDSLSQRLSRFANSSAAKRQAILHVMTEAGLNRLRQEDVTLSVRDGMAGLVVTDETVIPEWCWIPQPPRLDRTKIISTLKAGDHIPGTRLSDPKPQLQIRSK